MKKYHYLYKITCTVSSMVYIGVHSTNNLDDGYLGSGTVIKNKIKKHGRAAMVKEIIEFYPDRETALAMEAVFVDEIVLNDPLSMNIRIGGKGNTVAQYKTMSEEAKVRKSNTLREKWEDPEYRLLMNKTMTEIWKNPTEALKSKLEKMRQSRLGSKHTDEVKATISAKTHSSVIWIVKWDGNFHYIVDSIVEYMTNCDEIPFTYSVVFHTLKKADDYRNRLSPVSATRTGKGPSAGLEVCRFPDTLLTMEPAAMVQYLYDIECINGTDKELMQLVKTIQNTSYRFHPLDISPNFAP